MKITRPMSKLLMSRLNLSNGPYWFWVGVESIFFEFFSPIAPAHAHPCSNPKEVGNADRYKCGRAYMPGIVPLRTSLQNPLRLEWCRRILFIVSLNFFIWAAVKKTQIGSRVKFDWSTLHVLRRTLGTRKKTQATEFEHICKLQNSNTTNKERIAVNCCSETALLWIAVQSKKLKTQATEFEHRQPPAQHRLLLFRNCIAVNRIYENNERIAVNWIADSQFSALLWIAVQIKRIAVNCCSD